MKRIITGLLCFAFTGIAGVSWAGLEEASALPDSSMPAISSEVQSGPVEEGRGIPVATAVATALNEFQGLMPQAQENAGAPVLQGPAAPYQPKEIFYLESVKTELCAAAQPVIAPRETYFLELAEFAVEVKPQEVEDGSVLAALEQELMSTLPEIPIVVNKSVESFIQYFQTNGRKHFVKWLDRSQSYMFMIKNILREESMPEDLFYIALIESGLSPTVKSRANAVGMWQFIKGTALMYGLRVDWWIDERRDPEKATRAASRYFKNLYGMFGSWYLAAAGYNAGEGKVMKAIKKHGSDDFWVLANQKKPFRRETKDYVPKYLAAMMIAKDPKTYGFDEVQYREMTYDKVTVPQATDLRVIAEAADTDIEEIRRLNPELLRWFTPPNYPEYQVKIPAGRASLFHENMSKIPPPSRIKFQTHKVKRGETLSKIARRYGVETKPIMYLNELKGMKLKPGTTLMIPVPAKKGASGSKMAGEPVHWELQS